MTFTPTHVLISRTKETPVQLVAGPKGYGLYTETEFNQGTKPAFEVRPKLGFYCLGQQVVGFHLRPLNATVAAQPQVAQSRS
jgi:hypothetical protein